MYLYTCRACVHVHRYSCTGITQFNSNILQLVPKTDSTPCPLEHNSTTQNHPPTIQMLTSISRRLLPLRNYVQASSAIQRDTWTRNFQSSPRVEAADSMGKLIESGKEGAEFVVSGKLKKKKEKETELKLEKQCLLRPFTTVCLGALFISARNSMML